MSNDRLFLTRHAAAPALVAAALLLSGCRTVAVEGPHIRPIDNTCLPAGQSPAGEIPLYHGEIATLHAKIATIDSFASESREEETVKAQLQDLQCKARLAGADALTQVRPLAHQLYGFVNDPNTPFPSRRQGASQSWFFRATAIKYQEPVVGEPAMVETKEAPLPAAALLPGQTRRTQNNGLIPISSPLGRGPSSLGGPTPKAPIPAPNPVEAASEPIR